MSVQFGRCNFDDQPVDRDYLEGVNRLLTPYGPDGAGSYATQNVGILYRAFHTTAESRLEKQPHITQAGAVITWDGRLDNREELIQTLSDVLPIRSTDVSIVAAAYERWGNDCFARLIGDWALSIWDPIARSLILAKDPIGARHLYYSIDKDQVTWCTILDPLVVFAGKKFVLCEEYIAGWFSFFPAAHLTPYVGIHSVPPSSWVFIQSKKHTIHKYWDFDPAKKIRHRSDAEYEEHFRAAFAQSVRRRLRSDSPTLAELSGGMDSSAIVCMADTLIALGDAETPRLDTISYYDDSEPNWNERPYFAKVEEKRGSTGCHIDVSDHESFHVRFCNDRFASTPCSGGGSNRTRKQFAECLTAQRNRVVLSGIGGDEVTGGMPTPAPELEDLIASAKFGQLTQQLKLWALNKRKPWFHLYFEAVSRFFPPDFLPVPKHMRPAPWLRTSFVERHRAALASYPARIKLFGALPSVQENFGIFRALQRQMACAVPAPEPRYEKAYPYLDRDLVEFLFAIPREQLVRPGQRRSLMRRALVGIVPEELLQRRRKAFAARGPRAAISTVSASLQEMSSNMICATLGFVNPRTLRDCLQQVRHSQEISTISLMRTLHIEFWLRNLQKRGILAGTQERFLELPDCPTPTVISAETK